MEAALLGLRRSHRSIRPNLKAVGLVLASILFLAQGSFNASAADEIDESRGSDKPQRVAQISFFSEELTKAELSTSAGQQGDSYVLQCQQIITKSLCINLIKTSTKHQLMTNGDNVAIINFNPCSSRGPPLAHA